MATQIHIKRIDIDRFNLQLNDPTGGTSFYLNKQEMEVLIREALKSLNPMGFELKENKEVLNG